LTTVSISASLIESLAKAAMSRTNFVAVIAPLPVAFGLARSTKYSTIQIMRAFTCLLGWRRRWRGWRLASGN
jgi:hypothetical protein